MPYITLNEAKAYIGNTQTTDDTLIENVLIPAAEAFIESDAGAQRRYQVSADTTRSFDAERDTDGRALYLDGDLCQITSITNGDGTTIASSQYVTETAGGDRNSAPWRVIRLRQAATVYWQAHATNGPENAIAIVGRWGASTTPPEKVKQWTRELVAYLYRRQQSGGDGDRPLLTGDGITILPSDLPRALMRQMIMARPET